MRIRDQRALPLPSQNSVQVQVCMRTVLSKRRKEESPNAHISQYIYYTLHTLFGSLDLMGQSSELEWAHKKIKQQCAKSHYKPQYKN